MPKKEEKEVKKTHRIHVLRTGRKLHRRAELKAKENIANQTNVVKCEGNKK